MADEMEITAVEVRQFEYTLENMGTDHNGFNVVYSPGETLTRTGMAIRITTDGGLVGEWVGGSAAEYATLPMVADYLLGSIALERERIYTDLKRALRQVARLGMGPVDIALWDLAGKFYGAPIYELLGGYKQSLPSYASTYHGDEAGGLSDPAAYADFAHQCLEMGYPAFKIHGWGQGGVDREIATVHAVRERVGDTMDLMIDPACELVTLGQAIKLGWACDEAGYFWYEDPFRDGGISQFGHRKLRQLIRTPLLMTEHVRSLEPHIDFVLADATDFVRGDVGYDGITGVMKLAHAAEALGIDIEFHGPGPAQRHCMAAVRNTNYYEMGLLHPGAPASSPPVYKDDYRDEIGSIDERGNVSVPQESGLGVEYDWDYISRHEVDRVEYR